MSKKSKQSIIDAYASLAAVMMHQYYELEAKMDSIPSPLLAACNTEDRRNFIVACHWINEFTNPILAEVFTIKRGRLYA